MRDSILEMMTLLYRFNLNSYLKRFKRKHTLRYGLYSNSYQHLPLFLFPTPLSLHSMTYAAPDVSFLNQSTWVEKYKSLRSEGLKSVLLNPLMA